MASESGPAINPIHQFSIHPVVPIQVAGHDISLTNSGLFMLLAVALSCLIAAIAARGDSGVPTRMQAMGEMVYEFVAGMVRSASGEAGMRFFPFVFSIFLFVLLCNLIGFIPYSFTVTSQIVITATLALMVFFTVIIIGIAEHGLQLLQDVRALGRAGLHSAGRGGARGLLFFRSPGQPLGASLRQHARRPHYALRVRRLRDHAARRERGAQGRLQFCPWPWRSDWKPSNCSSRSCRPTCSRCSPACISTTRFTPAGTDLPISSTV